MRLPLFAGAICAVVTFTGPANACPEGDIAVNAVASMTAAAASCGGGPIAGALVGVVMYAGGTVVHHGAHNGTFGSASSAPSSRGNSSGFTGGRGSLHEEPPQAEK